MSHAQRLTHAAHKTFQPADRPRSISHHPTRAKAQDARQHPTFARAGESCAHATGFAVVMSLFAVILSGAKDLCSSLGSFFRRIHAVQVFR
jgi:hypothetical protein